MPETMFPASVPEVMQYNVDWRDMSGCMGYLLSVTVLAGNIPVARTKILEMIIITTTYVVLNEEELMTSQ